MYDLEWQHEVGTTPTKKGKKTRKKSPRRNTGDQTDQNVSVDLGPLFAKRGNNDLRQVDQSVNLMEFNDADSLDSRSPTQSQVSASSRRSMGRKTLNAPVRPSKFAKRPSHVNVTTQQDIDTSLLGVLEGRNSVRSERERKYNGRPDVSDVGPDKPNRTATAWTRSKDFLVVIVRLSIIAVFVAFGIFIFFSYNEEAAALALSAESSSAGEFITPSASPDGDVKDSEKDGEAHGAALLIDYDHADGTTADDRGVILSAHLANHQEANSGDEDNPLHVLEKIILEYGISKEEDLDYERNPKTPQVKSLLWLANSDASKIAQTNREISFLKLIQRYALGVFYYALGGHHESGDTGFADATQSEREIHILGSDQDQNYHGWKSNSRWMTETSVCFWHGVACNSENLVESLNLTGNGLRGSLPVFELFHALRDTLKSFDGERK